MRLDFFVKLKYRSIDQSINNIIRWHEHNRKQYFPNSSTFTHIIAFFKT